MKEDKLGKLSMELSVNKTCSTIRILLIASIKTAKNNSCK